MATAASEGTAVEKATTVKSVMTGEQARQFIQPFLPPGVDLDRVAASVMMAIRKDETGTLKKCTPESLVLGVAQVFKWGLELGPGQAYLLPFKNNKKGTFEATPVADYKALCELMVASRCVRHVEVRTVHEGDGFDYKFGTDGFIEHKPGSGTQRKPITHVYCILHLPFGSRSFDVMTAAEVEEIRQKYSKTNKAGPLTVWYAKKTIIRQVAKTMPKNPALAKLFAVVEQDTAAEIDAPDSPLHATATLTEDAPAGVSAGGARETDDFQDDTDLEA